MKIVICLLALYAFLAGNVFALDKSGSPPGPFRVEPLVQSAPGQDIGQPLIDFPFTDINGSAGRLSDVLAAAATVIVARDTGCPVSQKYAPGIGRLQAQYSSQGVEFLYLNLNPRDSLQAMRADHAQFGSSGRYIADRDHRIGTMLGVRSTGEVFVLDSKGRLVFRGAIDDQYGIGYTRVSAGRTYLRDALNALLAGRLPEVSATTAPGCYLNPGHDEKIMGELSWYRDIERIVQDRCQACHRPGEIGPFSLLSYEDIAARKEIVRFVLKNRIMPPWFASPESGPWLNKLRLSEDERSRLLAWIDQGMQKGKPEDGPEPRQWVKGWRIGKPDAILKLPEPVELPAEGVIPYQYAIVPTDFGEDKWVTGFEVRTRVPRSAHHILVFLRPAADSMEAVFGREEGSAWDYPTRGGQALHGFFAGSIVGAGGTRFPAGVAKRLPKGASLDVQLHYTASGVAATDQPEIGLLFADEPPQQELKTLAASSTFFRIPAHSSSHVVKAQHRFLDNGMISGFLPHMHLRGKAFRYELEDTDGNRKILLDVPRYDPNWQLLYQLTTPIEVRSGSVLHATAWFDNSAANPANPDPDKTVFFGDQVWDEMMIGYFDWIARKP